MKVSNCCGAAPEPIIDDHGGVDCDSSDFGICPKCGCSCQYIEEGEYELESPS